MVKWIYSLQLETDAILRTFFTPDVMSWLTGMHITTKPNQNGMLK